MTDGLLLLTYGKHMESLVKGVHVATLGWLRLRKFWESDLNRLFWFILGPMGKHFQSSQLDSNIVCHYVISTAKQNAIMKMKFFILRKVK